MRTEIHPDRHAQSKSKKARSGAKVVSQMKVKPSRFGRALQGKHKPVHVVIAEDANVIVGKSSISITPDEPNINSRVKRKKLAALGALKKGKVEKQFGGRYGKIARGRHPVEEVDMFSNWPKRDEHPLRETQADREFFSELAQKAASWTKRHGKGLLPDLSAISKAQRIGPVGHAARRIVDPSVSPRRISPQLVLKALGAELGGKLPRRRP